jgi:hypothetical protein
MVFSRKVGDGDYCDYCLAERFLGLYSLILKNYSTSNKLTSMLPRVAFEYGQTI